MTLGEILILVFVTAAFIFGVWGGLRLYRWNMRDRAEIEQRNKEKIANPKE